MAQNSALKLLLEKQITSEQYKIIDDYKRMAEELEREQERSRSNSAKLQDLQKKVSCLQFMNATSARESTRYQRKLEKLESTQNYATQLLRLKYDSFMQMEHDHSHKHQLCLTKREQLARNRQLSQSLHDRSKNDRLKRMREEEERISLDFKKRSSETEALTRERKEEVRDHEIKAKDRKRRYEIFKLQRAAFNYNEKLEQEVTRFKEKTRHLQELRGKARREEQVFRKTQLLNKETLKIESMYLTGAPC